MALSSPSPVLSGSPMPGVPTLPPHSDFFVWREFLWGALAGGFGEGMMHPIDTVKTRIQSQAIISGIQGQKNILQMVRTVWVSDGLQGFYRGITPGVTGSLATGATYFGVIESTKKLLEEVNPRLSGHWSHFIAGAIGDIVLFDADVSVISLSIMPHLKSTWSANCKQIVYEDLSVLTMITSSLLENNLNLTFAAMLYHLSVSQRKKHVTGDTLGSFVYVPCEVVKLRMQVQGTRRSWTSTIVKENISRKPGERTYGYYTGMFQAGHSIWKQYGLKGLYAGYWSTLARDVPFAGLMVTFYEALKDVVDYGTRSFLTNTDLHVSSSFEGLVLGGLAGGLSAHLTTPLDVIKTRLQVQGSNIRYNGWLDALKRIWISEGFSGLFKGSIPRIMWYVPASALTFMAVEFLRDNFNEELDNDVHEVASISLDGNEAASRT